MTRRASILAILLLMLAYMPGGAGAQAPDEGNGVAADAEVKASAIAFVREFVDRINQHDPVAFDLAVPGYWSNTTREGIAAYLENFAPIKLYGVGSVKTHAETGHVSVQVWYSGFWTDSIYWTERWFLQPVDGGYLMDHYDELTPKAAGDLIAGNAEITLANGGLTMDNTSFSGITLLILKTTNLDPSQALTTGIYEIPDGVSAEEAQNVLVAGNFGAYRYLGPTPLHPGQVSTWAFLIEPGRHYLVQEWTLDPDLRNNVQIIQGAAYALTFTVS